MTDGRQRHLVLEGVLHPDPREPVAQVPFDVPLGCVRVALRYEHEPGATLDLGLLDVTATAVPTDSGFRGWSGGARREAFVSERDATPGYLPGPLPAGRWHVLLGRAKVGPEGCRYRVDVTLELEPDAAAGAVPRLEVRTHAPSSAVPDRSEPTPPNAPVPAALDDPWVPGDLQSHTHHSDAQGSVAELLAAANARGLRFLAVTDHNTISHHADLARQAGGPVLGVPGLEITTYRGHANVWGAAGWVDFRLVDDDDVAAMVRRTHELGGLVSVNHPKTQPGCLGCDWRYAVPAEVDALEAWQGPWWLRNWESLERYDRLLAEGRRLSLVGGSDRHQPAGPEREPDALRVGSPTTWLQLAQVGVPEVLAAIRAGRACVGEGPRGPRLAIHGGGVPMGSALPQATEHDLEAEVVGATGERLRWVGVGGVVREVAIARDPFVDRWTWCPGGPFVRAEVVAEAGLAARRLELAAWAAIRPLPYGITTQETDAHPWRLALSNPLYA